MNRRFLVVASVVVCALGFFGCEKKVADPITENPNIYFEVMNQKIVMHHNNATYDCCAIIVVRTSRQELTIDFLEQNVSTKRCDSLCTFNLEGASGQLDAGYYDCRIWNSDTTSIIYQGRVCVPGGDIG